MTNTVTVRVDEIVITAPANRIKVDGEAPHVTKLSFHANTITSAKSKARKALKQAGFTFDRESSAWTKNPIQRWMAKEKFHIYATVNQFTGKPSASIIKLKYT